MGGHDPGKAVDENVKTFWLARDNGKDQWLRIDLEKPAQVFAVQVNYFDYKSDLYGRSPGRKIRYVIEGSADGVKWETLVDRENSFKDTPNDYVELSAPQTVRYVRYRNIYVPTPNLAISGLRVFGLGQGKVPPVVKEFTVKRSDDRRDAMVTWAKQPGSQGYNVIWGIAPDKLYSSWMVYDDDHLEMRNLNADQEYYFTIEAFNENGVSERAKPVKVE